MPLSWNEIKSRALSFSKKWKNEFSEDAEAKSFWDDFFDVFGISRKRVASFEEPVKKMGGKQGFIDLFWKGVILVEHKSRGRDLDKAYTQALDYFAGIAERDLPKYVLVSDFARFRLYDLEADSTTAQGENYTEFSLEEFYKNVRLFGFIAGYQTHKIRSEDPVNIKAAEMMGKLHDQMKEVGYEGHPLEVYLVRLLFCMFAEDTGIFERQQFQDYIENHTARDGSDLGHHLNTLFWVLNTPSDKRLKNLDEDLAAFAYINGQLFEEMLPPASFDTAMRGTILDCCALDWSRISPAIFGSLFQSIMDKQARRNLGAHYTSEENILKLIGPLFLDDLRTEFDKAKGNKRKLEEFHKRLGDISFLDPACGCGNFLVITYRELRQLELEVLRALRADDVQGVFDISNIIWVDIEQFYGIEIEEFPARIAEVALWLMDHQMNLRVSEEYGSYFARIPLKKTSNIVCGNALRLDWNEVIPAEKLDYILGNPPFIGHQWRTSEQQSDMDFVWGSEGKFGRLDFVTCWHKKSANFMKLNPKILTAFVSTNSIVQGEQVSIIWPNILTDDFEIFFAHRTFQWNNEAKGKAAVHCIIVGFGKTNLPKKLYDYENIRNEATLCIAKNISPYLVDAPTIYLPSRTNAPVGMPEMKKGSQPTDGGFLLISEDDRSRLLKKYENLGKWIRRFVGGEELINNKKRYCFWLKDIMPEEIKKYPEILERIENVKKTRMKSPTRSVVEYAQFPTLFTQDRQPNSDYLALSEVSSENRYYLPIAYLSNDNIAANTIQIIPSATKYIFGLMCSVMHNSWLRTVCGRMKSDYRYTPSIYNNFPWPTFDDMDDKTIVKLKSKIEECAGAILDARAQFPESSLADLYDPLTMPPVLLKAHQNLDKAVDAAYGVKGFKSEADRVAFLFELYQQYTSFLPVEKVKKGKKK